MAVCISMPVLCTVSCNTPRFERNCVCVRGIMKTFDRRLTVRCLARCHVEYCTGRTTAIAKDSRNVPAVLCRFRRFAA